MSIDSLLAPESRALAGTPKLRDGSATMAILDGFLREDVARAIARFMQRGAAYEREHMAYPDRHLTESEWLDLATEERLLSRSVVNGVKPGEELHPDTLTFLRFRAATATEEFAAHLARCARWTGLALAKTTPLRAYAMHPGDFIAPHDDGNNEGKQIAVILYLSPSWDRDQGGALCIADEAGSAHVVEPRFNRLVAFPISDTKHWVERVRPGAPARLSISGWY